MKGPAFAAAALLVALLACLQAPAAHAQVRDLLPDLVADAPGNVQPPQVNALADGQNHLLLRFDGTIRNGGAGALEIRASRPVGGVMTVSGQRIFRSNGTFRDDNSRRPPLRFEDTDGHGHWHLQGAARYSLWNEAGTAEVAPASKVGFCLLDSERVGGSGPTSPVYTRARTDYCGAGNPTAAQLVEGISPGWLDFYAAELPFQWVDLSGVAPGRYRLAAAVDPNNFVIESNEANNGPVLAESLVTVPGYLALPGAAAVPRDRATTIPLGAEQHGAPGPRVFAIESPPQHGTLSTATGAPFGGDSVIYRPRAGYNGRDSFTFSARDWWSGFPVRAPAATVTLTVGTAAARKARPRLVAGLRFSRRGRTLTVRGRARKTGLLRIRIKKGKRNLGSCAGRVRKNRRFVCRIRLRRGASPRGARAIVSLRARGKPTEVQVTRVPRRL